MFSFTLCVLAASEQLLIISFHCTAHLQYTRRTNPLYTCWDLCAQLPLAKRTSWQSSLILLLAESLSPLRLERETSCFILNLCSHARENSRFSLCLENFWLFTKTGNVMSFLRCDGHKLFYIAALLAACIVFWAYMAFFESLWAYSLHRMFAIYHCDPYRHKTHSKTSLYCQH